MKTAMLIIDLQQGLLAETPPARDAAGVIERINALAGRARNQGATIIYIQHEEPAPSSVEFGTPGWELDARLKPSPRDLRMRKTTVDAFFSTDLTAMLEQREIEELIICGYASEYCITTTTRRAAALGYVVTLVADAHTTQDRPYIVAEVISRLENETLGNLSGFPGKILTRPADSLYAVAP